MIASLPLFHAVAGKPVIVLGEGEAAQAKRRLVERAGGLVVADDGDSAARLAFVATDDPEPVAERLRARGVLVNVPDRPELCDFTVPSILDRAPVLVAIGTGGASAGLAKALRLRLETLLPSSLGKLALALAAARDALRRRWPAEADRRIALDQALAPGGPLDPLSAESADRLADWLENAAPPAAPQVSEIRLVSTDPGELTLNQLRLLGSAGTIAHELGVPQSFLDLARADAARVQIEAGSPVPDPLGIVVILRR